MQRKNEVAEDRVKNFGFRWIQEIWGVLIRKKNIEKALGERFKSFKDEKSLGKGFGAAEFQKLK